jgi:hypothetical protein
MYDRDGHGISVIFPNCVTHDLLHDSYPAKYLQTAVADIIVGEHCSVAKAVNIVPIKISQTAAISNSGICTGISQEINVSRGKGGVVNILTRLEPTPATVRAVEEVRSSLHLLCGSVPPVHCSLTPHVNAGFGVKFARCHSCR